MVCQGTSVCCSRWMGCCCLCRFSGFCGPCVPKLQAATLSAEVGKVGKTTQKSPSAGHVSPAKGLFCFLGFIFRPLGFALHDGRRSPAVNQPRSRLPVLDGKTGVSRPLRRIFDSTCRKCRSGMYPRKEPQLPPAATKSLRRPHLPAEGLCFVGATDGNLMAVCSLLLGHPLPRRDTRSERKQSWGIAEMGRRW